jgi:hypothetical protein
MGTRRRVATTGRRFTFGPHALTKSPDLDSESKVSAPSESEVSPGFRLGETMDARKR